MLSMIRYGCTRRVLTSYKSGSLDSIQSPESTPMVQWRFVDHLTTWKELISEGSLLTEIQSDIDDADKAAASKLHC